MVSKNGGVEEHVARGIKIANGVSVQLNAVCSNHNISESVKIQLFNTNVQLVLLYACETWKINNQITRR